jgi:hypothetical protein
LATYKDSQRQENRLAKELSGSVNSGSGNGWIRKSDVRTEHELWECKITDAKSYSLKDAELVKNVNYALMDGRIPIFMVEFKPTGNSYVILTKDDYLALRERAMCGNETEIGSAPVV